jgi:predicted nucleotidyltransferase
MDEQIRFFADSVRKQLGDNVKQIILFGSHARGDSHEGSDYDFVVIVGTKDKDIHDCIINIEVEFLNRFDTLSASLLYDEKEWEERMRLPIGVNIGREGIAI